MKYIYKQIKVFGYNSNSYLIKMDIQFLAPIFFKASDVPNFKTLKEFEVCKAVFEIIGQDNLQGCQRIRGLWRIYVKTDEDRIKLITNRITLRNQSIGLYKNNPFRSGIESPDQEVVKVTITDVPLSKGNSGIEKFILEHKLEKTSDLQFGKVRDEETKEFTDILSGSRIVFVKEFENHIPRRVNISGSTANVYYAGQVVQKRPMLCTNCYSTEHYKSQCQNEKACIKCKETDHEITDTNCNALLSKPNTNITAFQGSNDILSNFYPCNINMHGILAKSSEHAYQYVKAIRRGRLDIATKIKNASNALGAKMAARDLPYSDTWAEEKAEVMTDILNEKVKQVPEFKEELLQSQSHKLVEAVPGELFWSSGLNKMDTSVTKIKYWPGKNIMGSLLTKLREDIKGLQNEFTQGHGRKKPKKKKNKDKQESDEDDELSHESE